MNPDRYNWPDIEDDSGPPIGIVEEYFILYDPEAQRYYSDNGGRQYRRYAKPFMTIEAARNTRDGWWKNRRFREIQKVTLSSVMIERKG
jgi:hypothetical protein